MLTVLRTWSDVDQTGLHLYRTVLRDSSEYIYGSSGKSYEVSMTCGQYPGGSGLCRVVVSLSNLNVNKSMYLTSCQGAGGAEILK